MKLLTGAVASTHDSRDRTFAIAGASPAALTSIDVTSPHIPRVQGQPSCVGYATWTAVQDLDLQLMELDAPVLVLQPDGGFVTVRRTTFPLLPILSGQWGYTGGRILGEKLLGHTLDPQVGLPNGGSSKRLNIMWGRDAANGGGARAETVWPDVPENATRLPPARVDQADALVAIGGFSRIRGEGDPDALRRGIWAALQGFREGRNSKPDVIMLVGDRYAKTPVGEIYDDAAAANDADLAWHDQLVGAFHEPSDTVTLHSTWTGAPTYRVRIEHLAALRGESWVLHDLIYIPRAA